MSDDIRAGDVVVCVDAAVLRCRGGRSLQFGHNVKRGRIYRVVGLKVSTNFLGTPMACGCLGFVMSDGSVSVTHRFRKIDAPKTELSERIKACKPIKHREPA